jgi:CheY-like chemotaxis protein
MRGAPMDERDRGGQAEDQGLKFFGLVTAGVTHEIKNCLALINEYNGLLGDLVLAHEKGRPLNLERIKSLVGEVKGQVAAGGRVLGSLNRFAHSVDDYWQETELCSMLEIFAHLGTRRAAQVKASLDMQLPENPLTLHTSPFLLLQAMHQGLDALLGQAPTGARLLLAGKEAESGIGLTLALEGEATWQAPPQIISPALLQGLGARCLSTPRGWTLFLPPVPPGSEAGKGRILLVDDRADFLAVISERMAGRGYQVTAVDSGAKALEAAQGSAFDVVILDMVMPGMDGLQTLKGLLEQDPNLAVIVLTGYASSSELTQALALGAHDFLVKPADLESLLARVDQAIESRRAQG